MTKTIRLSMAQALIRFLDKQYIALDGQEYKFVQGIMGIFGHGNVTGIGEALEYEAHELQFIQGHNEQGMVHAATAYAKQRRRMGIFACTSSIGPGATNMITGAATATANRLPVLLLPGDIFADRQPDPVLQQIENPSDYTQTVNDCFKPVSRYWDRINRPEQLMTACINAFRVLSCPVNTGAVTLCLPQDVQAELYDYPVSFFNKRVHYLDRVPAAERAIIDAASLLSQAKRPLIIAGGGVHYSHATEALETFCNKHKIPVCETQAGKGALLHNHPMNMGGIGVLGSQSGNILASKADVILSIGSRLNDFVTASKSAFRPDVKIINLNISRFDSLKLDSIALVADAKHALRQLSARLDQFQTQPVYQNEVLDHKANWQHELARLANMPDISNCHDDAIYQTSLLSLINKTIDKNAIVVGAAGSLPGDLQRLWQVNSIGSYHLEYANSCMGYEVSGGLGVKLSEPDNEVYVIVGDGSYLMLHSELFTCIQEKIKINIIVFDNQGYQCIKNLQKSQGSAGYGNEFRHPIDFALYAKALGAKTFSPTNLAEVKQALEKSKQETVSTLIHVPVLAGTMSDGYHTWWRVPVSSESQSPAVKQAAVAMAEQMCKARAY